MGVEVLCNARVTNIVEGGLTLLGTVAHPPDVATSGNGNPGEEHLTAGCMIWAAGVTASPAGSWLGAETDRAGRVNVTPELTLPAHPEVFVIGDTATVIGTDSQPIPGIAPAAKQMGRYVGGVIAARVAGRAAPQRFHYRHHGNLATIGRHSAVVELGKIRLTGWLGWIFWSLAHVWYLIGFRSRFVVGFEWLWSYLTLQRGARLITWDEPRSGRG
jgi:NADH:ubiquinone reductase (H+-translocating)